MSLRSNPFRILLCVVLVAAGVVGVSAQGVKRVVIVKIDGLPGYYVDRFVKQRDPDTGKSVLPWFEEIFYKNGTRVPNFYTRGMSLSGPSWGQLDTGQHLQIKGNVEYDRYTLHAYDYLNFFPYYLDYSLAKKADMPAVEVMDQLKIPLLSDAFAFEKRYTSQQLYQRGNDWAVLASGFVKLYPGNPDDFIDEWTMGLNYRGMTIEQAERDITGKLGKRPEIDYYDYYDASFDHVSHHNNDDASRFTELKALDRVLGKIWVAIQASSRSDETALILVSDHGFNSREKVYSQGFNLVKMLASAAGGGHHVITKRRLMLDYSIKGIYPLVPLIRTTSADSSYLKGQSNAYPTALLDFDGNERSSIHLRNSDLNVIHILLQLLQANKLSPEVKEAATDTLFKMIGEHARSWQDTADQMDEELNALHRWIEAQQKIIPTLLMRDLKHPAMRGVIDGNRRLAAQTEIAITAEADYRKYIATLRNLLELKKAGFDAHAIKIQDLVAAGAMGDPNTLYQLQNYIVGASPEGLTLGAGKELDLDKSFRRVNYFELLHGQKVRNNVQPQVTNRPIDFTVVRVPAEAVSPSLPSGEDLDQDPIWLFDGEEKQALILSRSDGAGGHSYRYLPVSWLHEDENGKITFNTRAWGDGLPLRFFEDKDLAVPPSERSAWLGDWHTEIEWLRATHKTVYSNAIIGLNEQLDRHPISDRDDGGLSGDDKLIARLRQRQRHLTEADLLILANDHWNFDVRGFNPGGNHGSFFRVSTNSTLMIAGGLKTGIPRSLTVEEPYDGMSFVPTVLRLMGKIDDENRPAPELYERGFRRFPGRVIREVVSK